MCSSLTPCLWSVQKSTPSQDSNASARLSVSPVKSVLADIYSWHRKVPTPFSRSQLMGWPLLCRRSAPDGNISPDPGFSLFGRPKEAQPQTPAAPRARSDLPPGFLNRMAKSSNGERPKPALHHIQEQG